MATILIVDDEPEILTLLRLALERQFDILMADDGQQAVELAQVHHPDLILMDVIMPVMDGLEAIRLLKADEQIANIPVIILSAKSSSADIVVGKEAGADDYITKPFAIDELTRRIQKLLSTCRRVGE